MPSFIRKERSLYTIGEMKKNILCENSSNEYEREIHALSTLIVHRKFKPVRQRIESLQFIDMKGIYGQLFSRSAQVNHWLKEGYPEDWEDICRLTTNMLAENRLLYEDATPFLLLQELIQGFQMNSSIKQVLVDEAQDYSSFQFEFLKQLFPAAKMTILGDFNQAILPHADESSDFRELANLYGPEQTEVITLTRSYRSTKPIIEFTRRLIPAGDRITPFERDGEMPTLLQVETHTVLHQKIVEKALEYRNQGCQTVAVICKSAAESMEAYDALKHSLAEIKIIKSNSLEYEQGIVVLPAYLAKGIEFDAVIIYNASEQVYGEEGLRRLFYTACTRAMHYLQLYSVGEPTRFLRGSDVRKFLRIETNAAD